MNLIASLKRSCVVRVSDKPLNQTFHPETDTLREEIISSGQVPGLSMNLLGGKLHLRHLKYRAVGPAMEIWNKPSRPRIKCFQGFVQKKPLAIPIYFFLNEIHNKTFPYYKSNDPETMKLIKALNKSTEVIDGKVKIKGTCFVEHAPNKLNYWHVEILLKGFDDKEIRKGSSAWIKSAAGESYKNIIAVSAKKFIGKYSIIPKHEYLEVA